MTNLGKRIRWLEINECLVRGSLILIAMAAVLVTGIGFAKGEDEVGRVLVYEQFDGVAWLDERRLAADLDAIEGAGVTPATVSLVAGALHRGSVPSRESVAVAVAGGYQHFLSHIWPVFRDRRWPVTLFIDPALIGRKRYNHLDWVDLRVLADAGVTIGVTLHRDTVSTDSDLVAALADRLVIVEQQLGWQPVLALLPLGWPGSERVRSAQRLGFLASLGARIAPVTLGDDPYDLPRYPMTAGLWAHGRLDTVLGASAMAVDNVTEAELDAPSRTVGFDLADLSTRTDEIRCQSTANRAPKMTAFGRRVTLKHPASKLGAVPIHDICLSVSTNGDVSIFGLTTP